MGKYSTTLDTKPSSPKFGFGTAKRPSINGNSGLSTPAPGHYKIPSKVGNLENYTQARRDPQYKHV